MSGPQNKHDEDASTLLSGSAKGNGKKSAWWNFAQRFYIAIERPEKIHKQTFDFLPAALEVQETPPSPIGRAIIWLIAIFFVTAVTWAFFGRVDIVAVAQGKIIPSGKVKTIQSLEIGSIASIHVSEGQRVAAGDPLITLDNTLTAADSARLSQQLSDLELDLHRQRSFQTFLQQSLSLDAARTMYSEGLFHSTNLRVKNESAIHGERLLAEEIKEYLSRRGVLENELQKRAAELKGAQATFVKLQKTLPIITERAEALKKLLSNKLVARVQYLELEQQRISEEQDLLSFAARKQELLAALEEIKSQRAALLAESQKSSLSDISETVRSLQAIKQELVKADQRKRMQVLSAPINGTVQQLVIHTIGGVVTPAQQLMLIVPEHDEIEVEVFLPNKDIGFVWQGQTAEVKIDTFNFTKYGTIDAEIIDVSNDAIQDENLGLVYLTRVLLKRSNIFVNGKWINLSPGMSATVEIKTGKRRVIEYFLSPLLRYQKESIRER